MNFERVDHKPWGYYEVIVEEPDFKIKRIVVNPGKRMSLQRHEHRSEHWYIVKGKGIVTLNDNNFDIEPNQSTFVPVGYRHRIYNNSSSDLIIIEIQTGNYFGEDDIERYEDDFGRVSENHKSN
jgi:mannose-6-phosphate isomerase-like protein (cupin superfamily)